MARHKEFDTDAAVECAMQEFWAHGYAATTPQRLVDAIGIGRGSLYNAFGSKHGLYERALERYRDRETQRVLDVLDGPGEPLERIRAVIELVAEGRGAGCLMTNTATEFKDHDEVVAGLVRGALRHQHAAFVRVLRQGQRAGAIDPHRDPGEMATFLLYLLNGMQAVGTHCPEAGAKSMAELAIAAIRG